MKSSLKNGQYGCFVRSVDEPDRPPGRGALPVPTVKVDFLPSKSNANLMEIPPFENGTGQMYLMLDDIDLSYLVAYALSHGYMDEGRRFRERVEEIIKEASRHGWKTKSKWRTSPKPKRR